MHLQSVAICALALGLALGGCKSGQTGAAGTERSPEWSSFDCEGSASLSPCATQEKYVSPEGSGTRDGSSWANALAGLPDGLERDTVYWLSVGSYGGYAFDDASEGDAGITIRKATADAHGSDEGWSDALGVGQAVFGPIRFTGGRYSLWGGEPNGIRVVGEMGTEATVTIGGSHVVLGLVEIDGGVQKSGDRQTAGACMGADVSADYVIFDRCEIHNIADDGLGIYADHVKVLHSAIYDLHGCGTDSHCSGPCYNGHSDGLEISHADDIELEANLVYDVRSTAAIFMEDWGSGGVSNLVAYNNVFYTPSTSLTVYLQDLRGAKLYNNVIWGRTQGNRYGGLSIGNDVSGLEMRNNVVLNINFNHLDARYDPSQHDLDFNTFAMVDPGEYTPNANDTVGDPGFVAIPVSDVLEDHKREGLRFQDFIPNDGSPAIDSGASLDGMEARDALGAARPAGAAWDRGPIEVSR